MSHNKQKSTKSEKSRSSIAWSLNFSLFKSLLLTMININIMIVLIFGFVRLTMLENDLAQFSNTIMVTPSNQLTHDFPQHYQVMKVNHNRTSTWTNLMFSHSQLDQVVSRRLSLPNFWSFSITNKFDDMSYVVIFRQNQQPIQITYALAADVDLFWTYFKWLVLLEIIVLVSYTLKHSKKVKLALHPLSMLASSTKNLQKDVSNLAVSADAKQLKSIAGAIEKIDAQRLDKQVLVESSQEELQEITAAINDMLIRINQAVQSQTQFVSDASHELRTPIAIIQGYINLLDRWGKDDPQTLQESIDAIKSETENMKALVEHLLFLARGDNETIQLQRETFDIVEHVHETIKEMKFIDPDRTFVFDQHEPMLMTADKQLVKQTLRILIDNSMKYSNPTDPIIIRCDKNDTHTIITIQDQGIGIKAEDVSRVFDRFYRSDPARGTKAKGSGLGLAIAKWIVDKHEGYMEVISREGIGTRMIIYFKN